MYRRLNPDVIISGHWLPLWVQPDYMQTITQQGEAVDRLHRELLPLDDVDFGAEGFAARITPYQAEVAAGSAVQLEVEVLNPFARPEQATVMLVAPSGWLVETATATLSLAPNGAASAHFVVTPPAGEHVRRERVAADITVGGRRFGQQAEALLTVY